ncbi:MAG TPA: hypothetical protein VF221_08185 [Chloroflexota bacterium]
MDDPLRPASPDVPNLRILLAQEVARLRAALARQKDVLIALQQREREELRTLVARLTEQNRLLREQAAQLHQENARLCETPLALPPDPASAVKPATPKREKNVRKKRAHEHNHGRLKLERANRWVNHAAERCPQCGEQLSGGWIHRRIQVIDLPVTAPLEITQHRIFRRQCPKCKRWALPKRVGLEAGRMGCCRFGPRLIAAISVMHTVERLPQRTIQDRLKREYGLTLSHGGSSDSCIGWPTQGRLPTWSSTTRSGAVRSSMLMKRGGGKRGSTRRCGR